MVTGFLISAVVLALCAAAALHPPPRPEFLAAPAYLIGMTVNEMPIIWIGLGLVSLASGVDRGTWSDPVEVAAVSITVAAIGALAWSIALAVRSRAIPSAALDAALPAGWRDEHGVADLPAPVSVVRGVLIPFIRRRRGVARPERHRYGPHRRHRLLVIRGRRTPASAPVFVHFHGGRFRSGDAGRESLPLLRMLARRRWVCVSATYRLGAAGAFPASVVDATQVVAWIRSRADALGVDPERIVVAGNSAGAHLAMFVALTSASRRFQPGFEDEDTSVAAAVGLYGYYGPRSSDQASSPLVHATAAAPPIFVLHGDRDSVIPVEGAREFVQRMRRISRRGVAYAELPGAQHTFDYFRSVRADAVASAIAAFAEWATRPTARPSGDREQPSAGSPGQG